MGSVVTALIVFASMVGGVVIGIRLMHRVRLPQPCEIRKAVGGIPRSRGEPPSRQCCQNVRQ